MRLARGYGATAKPVLQRLKPPRFRMACVAAEPRHTNILELSHLPPERRPNTLYSRANVFMEKYLK